MHLMLRGDWQGHLKRSIRDADGNVIRSYEFVPKAPVELVAASDLVALEGDCTGKRPKLLPVDYDEKHQVVVLETKVIEDTIASLKPAEDKPKKRRS